MGELALNFWGVQIWVDSGTVLGNIFVNGTCTRVVALGELHESHKTYS